jgi:hypothetical protein
MNPNRFAAGYQKRASDLDLPIDNQRSGNVATIPFRLHDARFLAGTQASEKPGLAP